MSATDELRRMLDERGVEWETDGSGFRVMWGQPVSIDQMQFKAVDNALPNGGLNISICGFSPEQAIAATLGDNGAARSNNGVTAEQVRKAIFNGSSYASYDGAKYYADGIGMQAIADELNATLGAGTCERVRDDVSGLDVPHNGWYVCSKCGEPLPIMNRYCGSCGAIVRKLDA